LSQFDEIDMNSLLGFKIWGCDAMRIMGGSIALEIVNKCV